MEKIICEAFITSILWSTAAFAEYKATRVLSYDSFRAEGYLNGTWDWRYWEYDTSKARTERTSPENTTYKVYTNLKSTYLTTNSLGFSEERTYISKYDSGYQWAEVNDSQKNVYMFYSTHAIVNSSNIYHSVDTVSLSDW